MTEFVLVTTPAGPRHIEAAIQQAFPERFPLLNEDHDNIGDAEETE